MVMKIVKILDLRKKSGHMWDHYQK